MKDCTYSHQEDEFALTQTLPDREISTLSAVLDPSRLRKHLRFLSVPGGKWADLSEVRVQVLRFQTGRRCTFEIALCTPTGLHTLIGKVYASDGSEIFEAMRRISGVGFGPDAEFSIPQPVAYLTAQRLLLQEKVHGRLAKEIFVKGNECERAVAAERCAKWLARFHVITPKSGPVFDLNDYLMRLEQWSRSLAASADPSCGKVAQLFRHLERAASELEPIETCACHGDYSPAQVILADGRTATCDWDSHCVADPNRDVARFLVALELVARKNLGSIQALGAAAELFLKTYALLGRPVRIRNLEFYKAAYHLKMIQRKIVKPYWRERIETTLEESLRNLGPTIV